jgi:hypothetical protein
MIRALRDPDNANLDHVQDRAYISPIWYTP